MKVKTKREIHERVFDEFAHQNLTPYAVYEVIGISDDHYRVVNDAGEPILYPKYLFEVLDASIPDTWIRQDYGPDEYYIDPPGLERPGFYEEYFDNKPEARATFAQFLAAHKYHQPPDPPR